MTVIRHLPTQSRDGRPHLAYYADDVSFVWSGSAEEPIEVCSGGYGEPVTDEIWAGDVPALSGGGAPIPFPYILHIFREICDQWLRDQP